VHPELPPEFQGQGVNFSPKEILDSREVTVQGTLVPQVLIR